jgi:hypothetical protein
MTLRTPRVHYIGAIFLVQKSHQSSRNGDKSQQINALQNRTNLERILLISSAPTTACTFSGIFQ